MSIAINVDYHNRLVEDFNTLHGALQEIVALYVNEDAFDDADDILKPLEIAQAALAKAARE